MLTPHQQMVRNIQRAWDSRDPSISEKEMLFQLSKAFNYSEEMILEFVTEPRCASF